MCFHQRDHQLIATSHGEFRPSYNLANCLVETHMKLEQLIPATMVEYGLNRVQFPLWFQQSLINGFSWYGLSWAIVVSEHL